MPRLKQDSSLNATVGIVEQLKGNMYVQFEGIMSPNTPASGFLKSFVLCFVRVRGGDVRN